MHRFFVSIFSLFLTPHGVLVLSALDSTMLFFMPAAIDTAVVVMSVRDRDFFWLYPVLAASGSVAGAALTFALGHKVGEPGLKRWISEPRLKQVRHKIDHHGVVAMGMTAVLPPPFPLTPFVLASGAFGLNKRKFFLTLAASRLLRFGTESLLALAYGRRILAWLKSDISDYALSGLVVLALVGTTITLVQVVRKAK